MRAEKRAGNACKLWRAAHWQPETPAPSGLFCLRDRPNQLMEVCTDLEKSHSCFNKLHHSRPHFGANGDFSEVAAVERPKKYPNVGILWPNFLEFEMRCNQMESQHQFWPSICAGTGIDAQKRALFELFFDVTFIRAPVMHRWRASGQSFRCETFFNRLST